MKKTRAIEEWLIIGLFVIAISSPIVATKYKTDLSPSFDENRQLAQFPKLLLQPNALARFPGDFGRYFNDHFAFRRMLIHWHALVKVKWLGVSTSAKVIVGKDGWFFDANNLGPPLTQEQLARWREALSARNAWLAARGIKYLFVVAPLKQTIYPEYVREPGQASHGSRLDQLVNALRDSPVEIIDLRPALLEAKRRNDVYFKTDGHWNQLGSFIAYQAIIQDLSKSFPTLKPLPSSDLNRTAPLPVSGGLVKMLGLQHWITETDTLFVLRETSVIIKGNPGDPNELTESEQPGSGLRLVVFRDSFAGALVPFLSLHFSRAVYVWQQPFDRGLIESERPNVVIQEVYEGLIGEDPPPDVPGSADRKSPDGRPINQDPGRTTSPALVGAHELINCAGTIGFAWDQNHPDDKIKVDLYDGSRLLVTITAGAFRQDLVNRGIGDGRHAFAYAWPPELKDGGSHEIRVKFAGTNVELQGTPRQIKCEKE